MPVSHRHIGLALVLTLTGVWGSSHAFGGVKKLHPPRRHHTNHQMTEAAPAVIDTAGIDTAGLISQNFVREINRWSRVRYRKGGVTHKGADCSGFVVKVFQNTHTLQLPRTSREQANVGDMVDQTDLQFGDLVFFYRNPKKKVKRISHVGIYIGDGNFVHSSKHKGVGVDALSERYYAQHFALARRVADFTADGRNDSTSVTGE